MDLYNQILRIEKKQEKLNTLKKNIEKLIFLEKKIFENEKEISESVKDIYNVENKKEINELNQNLDNIHTVSKKSNIKDDLIEKNKYEIEYIISKYPEDAFKNIKYLRINKNIDYDTMHKFMCELYIYKSNKDIFIPQNINDIEELFSKSVSELLLDVGEQESKVGFYFYPDVSRLDNSIYVSGKFAGTNDFFKNIRDNKIEKFMELECFCLGCKKKIINYDMNISCNNNYQDLLKKCYHCDIVNSDKQYSLKYHLVLIKLIPNVCIKNSSIGNKLIRRLIESDYIDIALYYYADYIFDYLENNIICYIEGENPYIKDYISIITKVLYSDVNVLFIDKNDKYNGLLSIKLLYKSMGYLNKKYDNINDYSESCFKIFKILVDSFKLFKKSILFDLHAMAISNYGQLKHVGYFCSIYPEKNYYFD